MIIKNLYHTIIDTETVNINILKQYDGTTNNEATSTSFDITEETISLLINGTYITSVTIDFNTYFDEENNILYRGGTQTITPTLEQ